MNFSNNFIQFELYKLLQKSWRAQTLDELEKKWYLVGTGTLMQCSIRGSLWCHAALMRKESFPLCGLAEIDWSSKWVCGIVVAGILKAGEIGRVWQDYAVNCFFAGGFIFTRSYPTPSFSFPWKPSEEEVAWLKDLWLHRASLWSQPNKREDTSISPQQETSTVLWAQILKKQHFPAQSFPLCLVLFWGLNEPAKLLPPPRNNWRKLAIRHLWKTHRNGAAVIAQRDDITADFILHSRMYSKMSKG